MQPFKPKRLDFIGKPAPPGYVAGIGRGATGFTTRSDIGPAREAAAAAAMAAHSSGSSSSQGNNNNSHPTREGQHRRTNNDQDDEEDEYLNESNYDDFAGYGGSLVRKDPYEEDDEEADKIYEAIDKHMDERGKALREAKLRQTREQYRQERPKIQQQFSDLKAQLKQVTEEEWYNIPEVGDARNRKQRVARQDRYAPVPDSLLAHQMRLASGGERVVYIDPNAMDTDDDDGDNDGSRQNDNNNQQISVPTNQPGGNSSGSTTLNIGEMSQLRSSYMSAQLSRVSNSALTTNTVNPREYLDKYDTLNPTQITDESTLKEYRKEFASMRNANPHLANAWIASVRLEEAAGKLTTARALIHEGCKKSPKNVDLWLEAVRIHPPDKAQSLMTMAIKENPRSVRLWIKAAEMQTDVHMKRNVYEKAREMVPKSPVIWKKSVELEPPSEARKILHEAIECCPESVELFLGLARLESYEKAKEVLEKALKRHPTHRAVWIMKAKLEEAAGHDDLVASIIKTAIAKISNGSQTTATTTATTTTTTTPTTPADQIKRDEWLAEAADADKARFRATCHEIIKHVIGLIPPVVEPPPPLPAASSHGDDEKQKWKKKKTSASASGGGVVVKKEVDDSKRRLDTWFEDIRKFEACGALECTRAVYEYIVGHRNYRQVESNWIGYAEFEQRHSTNNQSDKYESLLRRAVASENCSKSETLWLMLARTQRQNNLHQTRSILSDALDANPDSERIILEAVELECENGNFKEARRILADACMSAKTPELVLRSAKHEWNLGNLDEACRMLKAGTNEYKNYANFYLMLGQIEEQRSNVDQAKVHYSNGLKFNPTSVELWLSVASAEEKTNFHAKARSKLEMARLRNPKCPRLWLESARFEIRAHQLGKLGARQGERPVIVSTILAKGIKECKDCPGVEQLKLEQETFNKQRFV